MSCQVIYSPRAIKDLDHVWMNVWDASGEIETADRYVANLRETVRQKASFPESGVPLNFLGEFTGIRYVRYKRYLAFYRIVGEYMEIGRVLFESSDYIKTLFGASSTK